MLLLENAVPRMGLLENLKLYMWLALCICWLLSWCQQMLELLNPSGIPINCQLLYGHCPSLPTCSVWGVSEFSLASWPSILYEFLKMETWFHSSQPQIMCNTYKALMDWALLSFLLTFLLSRHPPWPAFCFLKYAKLIPTSGLWNHSLDLQLFSPLNMC